MFRFSGTELSPASTEASNPYVFVPRTGGKTGSWRSASETEEGQGVDS